MRPIKFRQRNGDRWHYWGFIDDAFVTPCRYDTPSQQFTGLTDRYGVEIYEGDIIDMQQIQGAGNIRGIIHIGAEEHRPYDCRVWVDTTHDGLDKKSGWGGKYVFIHDDPEVIGNITENPELLK